MKRGLEADDQFGEMAEALREVGAGWIVDEVEELVVQGKPVPFQHLPSEDKYIYQQRLQEERTKGFTMGSPRSDEIVAVPYDSMERLSFLAEATERVISATLRAYESLTEFSSARGIEGIVFEESRVPAAEPSRPSRWEISTQTRVDPEPRLRDLRSVLEQRVLD